MATMEVGAKPDASVKVPATVPGSVQGALRAAGLLPDWNLGLNAQQCEWVENRHWIYETILPDEWFRTGPASGRTYRLNCLGLDYVGSVSINKNIVGEFRGTHVPHVFDLTPHLEDQGNVLRIAFELPPRWLGQFGFSSQMTEWKPRFNYTWDWQPRLLQVGIWDDIRLEVLDGAEIQELRCVAGADVQTGQGTLRVGAKVSAPEGAQVRVTLRRGGESLREQQLSAKELADGGVSWRALPVELWWPNGEGAQPLYDLEVLLLDERQDLLDSTHCRVGFRDIAWRQCQDAPDGAEPWICMINGRAVFLQGVNFLPTPRPSGPESSSSTRSPHAMAPAGLPPAVSAKSGTRKPRCRDPGSARQDPASPAQTPIRTSPDRSNGDNR